MDQVMLLNHSAGAIISPLRPYRVSSPVFDIQPRITETPLRFAPYVETVNIPVVSVDSSALYGDHPENLARITCSSGAALTFFCDSVAGGSDTSGDGSYDNPWRSLNTASRFLSACSDILAAAATYVQLKIRGTVDYLSGGSWGPFGFGSRLILAGWGASRVEISGARLLANCYFNLRMTPAVDAPPVFSDCTVIGGGTVSSGLAVDCELSGVAASCIYNCSGGDVVGRILYGGSFGGTASYPPVVSASYAYAPEIAVSRGEYSQYPAAVISCAAVGARIRAECVVSNADDYATARIYGIAGRSDTYYADCSVAVTASAYGSRTVQAEAGLLTSYTRAVVSGGSWSASAWASAIGGNAPVEAYASAVGFAADTASGAATALAADAHARTGDPDGSEYEYMRITSGGTTYWSSLERRFSSGVATSTTVHSGSF